VTAKRLGFAIAFALGIFSGPLMAQAQQAAEPSSPADTPTSHWEFSLDAQVGIPRGYIKVGEAEVSGTRLQLHEDLGIGVSEAVEAQAAYHLAPRDACVPRSCTTSSAGTPLPLLRSRTTERHSRRDR
jgi:hypothetical protein